MSTRMTRWLTILFCTVPLGVFGVIVTWVPARQPSIDPALPSRCVGIERHLVAVGPAKALEDATALAADGAATLEENLCAKDALAVLKAGAPPVPTPMTTTSPTPASPDSTKQPASLSDNIVARRDKRCQVARTAARQGDLRQARAEYRKLLDDNNSNPEVQACAVGGLSRLPSDPTLAEWSFAQANRVTRRVTGWFPAGPLVLGDGSKTIIESVVWLLTIGSLLVAFRQFVRWRRERWPGPVEIKLDDANDSSLKPYVALVRERLAAAGVYPPTQGSGLGSVPVDVFAVFESAGDTGRLGKLVDAIKSALTVPSGYVLTLSSDHDDTDPDGPEGIVIKLDAVGTGRTLCIHTYRGATLHDAAIRAAYEAYLELTKTAEVRRRTAVYLRWDTWEGLEAYHTGKLRQEKGDLAGAVASYKDALGHETGNLIVLIALGNAETNLALQQYANAQDDAAGGSHLSSLLHALQASSLNRHSYDAHTLVALTAGNVAQWHNQWKDFEHRDDINRLMSGQPSGEPDMTPSGWMSFAERQWMLATRKTWWVQIMRVAGPLQRRSTVHGYIWLIRRQRKTIHDISLAATVMHGYKRLSADIEAAAPRRHHPPPAKRWIRVRLRRRLMVVRYGRPWPFCFYLRRSPEAESYVQYNLAAAYVSRAVWKANKKVPIPSALPDEGVLKNAFACLDRSFLAPDSDLRDSDIKTVEEDPDLAELRNSQQYKTWRAKYRPDASADDLKKVWQDRFTTLATRAEAAQATWQWHLAQPSPQRVLWTDRTASWGKQVVAWLGEDLSAWRALKAWAETPTSSPARDKFIVAAPDGALNGGRPVGTAPQTILPGDDADRIQQHARDWEFLVGLCKEHCQAAEKHMSEVIDALSNHQAATIDRRLRAAAAASIELWEGVRSWCQDPKPTTLERRGGDRADV